MSRRRILAVTLLAVIGIAATSAADMPTKLLWNATASAPVGFYTIEPADRIEVPELVAVRPPEPLAGFMVERGYVGRGVPLLKRVVGLPGQRVCRTGRAVIGRARPLWTDEDGDGRFVWRARTSSAAR